jgi:hypothetical protein
MDSGGLPARRLLANGVLGPLGRLRLFTPFHCA